MIGNFVMKQGSKADKWSWDTEKVIIELFPLKEF